VAQTTRMDIFVATSTRISVGIEAILKAMEVARSNTQYLLVQQLWLCVCT